MNIANIGSFAGGLMRGHMAATEERRREEDQAFQQEQRTALREERARKERIRQGIAGVQRPGTELSRSQFMAPGIDGDEAIPGLSTVTRQTGEDYYRQLGDVYAREGDIDRAIAMGDAGYNLGLRRDAAVDRQFNLGQRERTLGYQRAEDENLMWLKNELTSAEKNLAAYLPRVLGPYNMDERGGPNHKGVRASISPDNQYVVVSGGPAGDTPQFIPARQAVRQLLMDEYMARAAGATPQGIKQYADYINQKDQRATQRLTAEAAMRNAATTEAFRADQRQLIAAQAAYYSRLPQERSDPNALRDPKAYADAITEFNNLAAQLENETDPAKRRVLERQLTLVQAKIANAAGKPMQIRQPSAAPGLKLVNDPGGAFIVDDQGIPVAAIDPRREFKMIPFGVDPRNDKKWGDISGKLGEVGASLAVVTNERGEVAWRYLDRSGRKHATWQDAVKPPELKQEPATNGEKVGGTATAKPKAAPQVALKAEDATQRLVEVYRQDGLIGVSRAIEEILGPRPTAASSGRGVRRGEDPAQAEWDRKREQLMTDFRWALQASVQPVTPGGAGLTRPAR